MKTYIYMYAVGLQHESTGSKQTVTVDQNSKFVF